MDVQQFISSGIIEAYVLGMASDAEVRELEALAAQHPEIAEAIDAIRQALERYSLQQAVEPPAGLKSQIWSAIAAEENAGAASAPDQEPATQVRAFVPREDGPMVKRNYGSLAAAVILLLGSLVLNFIFWNKSEQQQKALAAIKAQQEQVLADNRDYRQQLERSAQNMLLMMDPAMKPVVLAGVGSHTQNQAMIYWDTRSKEVYLAFKNMPPPPSGKQYQLWAIVDGKPVDAGMFALHQSAPLQKMKVIPQAEMFAITLEQEGGSEAPTMTEMYVAGKV